MQLEWGLMKEIPDSWGVVAAWGARAIATGKELDFPYDRVSRAGAFNGNTGFQDFLKRNVPWKESFAGDDDELRTITEGNYTLMYSPRGSHGYLYLTAYEITFEVKK